MEKTLVWDQKEIVILLRSLLDREIVPVIAQQTKTLENSFTLKMVTLLTQRILGMTNTQTACVDRLYDCLQQENARLLI